MRKDSIGVNRLSRNTAMIIFCALFMICGSISSTLSTRAKMSDVSDHVKQRVVSEFLREEKASLEEIRNRLRIVYGDNIVDVTQVASPDEREAWSLDKRVRERIVIQFLTSEKVLVKEIHARLKKVYGDCIPPSSVQRWSKQFRDGRSNVGNMPRPKV